MQSGMYVAVCMAPIFICMSGVVMSLSSLWFCLDSQSAMNRFGLGLNNNVTLYWCTLN